MERPAGPTPRRTMAVPFGCTGCAHEPPRNACRASSTTGTAWGPHVNCTSEADATHAPWLLGRSKTVTRIEPRRTVRGHSGSGSTCGENGSLGDTFGGEGAVVGALVAGAVGDVTV